MDRGKRFQKLQYVPKGTTKGTTNHSQQRKDEYVVSRKDCISSVSTSFVTSSGDDAGVAGVNESEALPCYASVPTSSGVQSQTVKDSVIAKTHPKSPGPMKPNYFKSTHRNESLTSTIYKPVTNTQKDIKIINKAPHMHSNFTAATTPTTYQQHVGKLSSSDTSGCHMFPPTNYRQNSSDYIQNASSTNRPNGRVSSLNDRPVSNDKFRNGESETSKEMTRGPRGHYNYFLLPPSIVNDEFETTISRDQYNLSDFQTEYETAKFYVIKSFNEDDVHKGVKYNVWTSTPNGNRKLNTAYLDSEAKLRQTDTKCPVFLFFSVNASGQFVGVAEMLGPVDFKKDMNFWKLDKYNGFFPIKWHIIKDVPNNQFVHIILRNNENKPVTFTRDTQEIGLKEGLEMLNIFKNYSAKTSLLDDFDFYENRERLFRSEKKTMHARPEQGAYGNANYQNTFRPREKKTEIQSSAAMQGSLVKLTKNLSLNSSGKQGFR
ncbi:uncharacterized protein LOC106774551 [Vigna radiata var. radiata]|uniref:YTH domain-containing family protein n=1 Tax=Vigna radiata var. radiata TaxID=3916 RepID=A0A1S3VG29_VIGRR|nr:uncharacterized protein LOC106774551 [Vigna radiata var. radiata]